MNVNKHLIIDCIPFEFARTSLSEGVENPNGSFMVKGVLQRAEAKNQNGRVYPFETLFREAKKYSDEFVRERRALGELDHPSCLSKTAQILTMDGWKFLSDISDTEVVMTLNTVSNKPEYQTITKKIDEPYAGEMYRFKGKNIDTMVTPNHRFVVEDRYGKLMFKTAVELYELNNKVNTHLKIPKANLCWEQESPTKFVLKGDASIEKYAKDVEIDYDVWMSFMGIWLSEGHCDTSRRDGEEAKFKSNGIVISQKHPDKTQKIWELLAKFPADIVWQKRTDDNGRTTFRVSDARLWNYLSPLGSCYDKYVPIELKNQSAPLLECLLEWYHLGDGRSVNDRGYLVENVFSVSMKLMEDLQEIQLKVGGNGNICVQTSSKDYEYDRHIIEVADKSPLYVLKFNKTGYIHIDNRFITIEKVDFDDRVYCVQVPNQTFYCRDNGKCYWSGNSEVVELKNVSHNIVEMHWEGKDLIGTVEVLPTPNGNILKRLFESNIRLGISSRGMGTVQKNLKEGVDVVQDDFVLLSFDFVSNPSTKGAFMYSMNEGVVHDPIEDKWVATENIIRELLSAVG
jgi:hypothetical protein